MWLKDPGYSNVIQKVWNQTFIGSKALRLNKNLKFVVKG